METDTNVSVVEALVRHRPTLKVVGPGKLHAPSYEGDVGWDLEYYGDETLRIWPHQFVDVPCGISLELPPGYWARITGRSSTLRQRSLLVMEGIIDTGYRGPLFVGVYNLGDHRAEVAPGARLAQLIPHHHCSSLELEEVEELSPSSRGAAGFGSTGL